MHALEARASSSGVMTQVLARLRAWLRPVILPLRTVLKTRGPHGPATETRPLWERPALLPGEPGASPGLPGKRSPADERAAELGSQFRGRGATPRWIGVGTNRSPLIQRHETPFHTSHRTVGCKKNWWKRRSVEKSNPRLLYGTKARKPARRRRC